MNVIEMIRRHGIEPRRVSTNKGGEYHSSCPGCGDGGKGLKSDRFHVWPDVKPGGSYWCRQCGKSGDNIQFLRDFDGLTYHEALARLGMDAPDTRAAFKPARPGKKDSGWDPRRPDAPEEVWQEHAGRFITWAFEQALTGEGSEFYAGRGLKPETILLFGLGWNGGRSGKDLYRSRESWGLTAEIKDDGGERKLWLPVGAVLPCFDDPEMKKVCRVRIRRKGPVTFGPKYYVVPGSSSKTLVLNPDRQVFVIVESEMDAFLVVQEAGDITGAVALGSVSAHPDEASAKILAGALHILNALDFDGPGAGEKIWWENRFLNSARWPVPVGKDPGEAFEQGLDIRRWVMAGLPDGLRLRMGV